MFDNNKIVTNGEVALDMISEDLASTEAPMLELTRWDVRSLVLYTRYLREELGKSNLG